MKKLILTVAMTMGLFVAHSQAVYTSDIWREMYDYVSIFNVWQNSQQVIITVNEEESTISFKTQDTDIVTVGISFYVGHMNGNSPKGYPYDSYYYHGKDTRGYFYGVSVTYIDGRTFVSAEMNGSKTSYMLNEKATIEFTKAIGYENR